MRLDSCSSQFTNEFVFRFYHFKLLITVLNVNKTEPNTFFIFVSNSSSCSTRELPENSDDNVTVCVTSFEMKSGNYELDSLGYVYVMSQCLLSQQFKDKHLSQTLIILAKVTSANVTNG